MSIPKPKRFLTTTALLIAGLGLAGSLALADTHGAGPFDAAIKARKAQMQLYAFNLGTLGAMAKGEIDYDAGKASAAAENLAALSGLNLAAAWPQGSDNTAAEGTRALPAIWENFPDVAAKSQALNQAATELAAAAGMDLDSLRGAIGPVGQACGACHKQYRAEQ